MGQLLLEELLSCWAECAPGQLATGPELTGVQCMDAILHCFISLLHDHPTLFPQGLSPGLAHLWVTVAIYACSQQLLSPYSIRAGHSSHCCCALRVRSRAAKAMVVEPEAWLCNQPATTNWWLPPACERAQPQHSSSPHMYPTRYCAHKTAGESSLLCLC